MSTANQFRDFEPINHEKPAVLMEKTFDKKCEIIFNCDVRVKGDILFTIYKKSNLGVNSAKSLFLTKARKKNATYDSTRTLLMRQATYCSKKLKLTNSSRTRATKKSRSIFPWNSTSQRSTMKFKT